MTHENKKADVEEVVDTALKLSEADRYKVLVMMQGIILIRASENETPKKLA